MPTVCKLPMLKHNNWFYPYSAGQELQVWPLAMVTSSYLLPLKLVTIFSTKTKRALAARCACFDVFLAAPAALSAQRYSCEGSLLKGSLNFFWGTSPIWTSGGSALGAGSTLSGPLPLPAEPKWPEWVCAGAVSRRATSGCPAGWRMLGFVIHRGTGNQQLPASPGGSGSGPSSCCPELLEEPGHAGESSWGSG